MGFCDPVLIDGQNGVLDGIVRVEAAKLLGLPHIPCIRANHLSASERRLVRMALNRLGEKGSWDFDELKFELEELIVENAPIEITGFSMTEIEYGIFGFLLVLVMLLRPQGLIPERRRKLELTSEIAAEDAQLVESTGP